MNSRFRLRFHLQEFDLLQGVTLLGRSSECEVTIEDPLVSRQHARIVIEGGQAKVEDLGSRNGVKVNGAPVRQPTLLKDKDRLRIGTQELVFCEVTTQPDSARAVRITGYLRYCATCGMPYPQESPACPTCGGTEQVDDTGVHEGQTAKESWGLQLVMEVVEKALGVDRAPEAARMLSRARQQVDERVTVGDTIPNDEVERLVLLTVRVALATQDPSWIVWTIRLYATSPLVPSPQVVAAWQECIPGYAEALRPELARLSQALTARGRDGAAVTDALSGVSELVRHVGGEGAADEKG